ncbi:MAG: cache domain-containing protein, partial [Rhodospirillales bacterium]|nr:cache domain-containing protein [Rhodospirillales bacterium]
MITKGSSPTALALLRIGAIRLVAGLCAAIWLAAATAIWLEHGRIRDEMEDNRARLSLSLAEHAERSLSEVELGLSDIARIAGHHSPPTREALQDHLRYYALMLPTIGQLTLTLADGTRLSAFPETAASPDFTALPPPGPPRGLVVGEVTPQADLHRLLPLFRAVFASDGRRVGTVTAYVSLDYFARFHRS